MAIQSKWGPQAPFPFRTMAQLEEVVSTIYLVIFRD